MSVTATFDLRDVSPQHHGYLRSVFEQFAWHSLGPTAFRYDGVEQSDGTRFEDWPNHVIPALMFLRSYVLEKNLDLACFSIDALSTSYIDLRNRHSPQGRPPASGSALPLADPAHRQAAGATPRSFVDRAVGTAGAPTRGAATGAPKDAGRWPNLRLERGERGSQVSGSPVCPAARRGRVAGSGEFARDVRLAEIEGSSTYRSATASWCACAFDATDSDGLAPSRTPRCSTGRPTGLSESSWASDCSAP